MSQSNLQRKLLVSILFIYVLSFAVSIPLATAETPVYPSFTVHSRILHNYANVWNIGLDEEGNLYVPEYATDSVLVYNRAGVNTENITGFTTPFAVESYGDNIYVADFGTDNISLIRNGVLINSTDVYDPRDIAVNSIGNIYVCNYSADEVVVFSSSFVQLDVIRGFSAPFSVAVGPDDEVYVADLTSDNISIFSPEHTLLGFLGQFGTNPGDINNPYNIHVDTEGYIYIADFSNDEVDVFSPDHTLVATISGVVSPRGLATDGTGRLYVQSHDSGGGENVTIFFTDELGDHEGPIITNVQINPLNPTATTPVTVTATIVDPSGVDNVTLTYTPSGGNATTVIMTSASDIYSAIIPAIAANTTVEFSIWAEDDSLESYTTTSAVYQYNIPPDQIPLPTNLLPIDPTILGLAGIGIGAVAIVVALMRRGSA